MIQINNVYFYMKMKKKIRNYMNFKEIVKINIILDANKEIILALSNMMYKEFNQNS